MSQLALSLLWPVRSAVAKQRGAPSAQALLEQGSVNSNPVLLPVRLCCLEVCDRIVPAW